MVNIMAMAFISRRMETTTTEIFNSAIDVDGAEKSMKMVGSTGVSGTEAYITA